MAKEGGWYLSRGSYVSLSSSEEAGLATIEGVEGIEIVNKRIKKRFLFFIFLSPLCIIKVESYFIFA
jgi:hypothetical protein